MRSHKFINSLLYLTIQLLEKESRANENNGGIRCFFVLFIDKRYIPQVIHFNSPKQEFPPARKIPLTVKQPEGEVVVFSAKRSDRRIS